MSNVNSLTKSIEQFIASPQAGPDDAAQLQTILDWILALKCPNPEEGAVTLKAIIVSSDQPAAALVPKLNKLLAVQSESDSSYAPVGKTDVEQMRDILYDIVELKYQADCDGDRPISFDITDLTRYEKPFYFPIERVREDDEDSPRRRSASYRSELQQRLTAVERYSAHAAAANEGAARHMRGVSMMLSDAHKKGTAIQLGNLRYVAKAPAGLELSAIKEFAQSALEQVAPTGTAATYESMEAAGASIADEATKKFGTRVNYRSGSPHSTGARIHLDVPSFDETLSVDTRDKAVVKKEIDDDNARRAARKASRQTPQNK